MRKTILLVPVSAGGFIEGLERELDWHKADDELHRDLWLCRSTARTSGAGRATCDHDTELGFHL